MLTAGRIYSAAVAVTERDLEAALDAVLGSGSELAPAVGALSAAYRSGGRPGEVLDSPTAARAYAAFRMPATFAAVCAALRAAGPGCARRPCSTSAAAPARPPGRRPALARPRTVLDWAEPALALGREIAAANPGLEGATWTTPALRPSSRRAT